jgi:hypothetical protein
MKIEWDNWLQRDGDGWALTDKAARLIVAASLQGRAEGATEEELVKIGEEVHKSLLLAFLLYVAVTDESERFGLRYDEKAEDIVFVLIEGGQERPWTTADVTIH